MLVKLVNFLCYENATYEFNKKGLHLLKGLNGVGKSTIMKAIFFAFYGTIRKPYRHGTNSCKVELDTHEIHISRSRSPNHLVVSLKKSKVVEENEAGQELIYQFLRMNHEQFLLSSYIRPHARSSLITLTPTEQLRMIESFTFEGDIHEKHRREILDMIKSKKEELMNYTRLAETSEEYYKAELEEFKAVGYEVKKCNIGPKKVENMREMIDDLEEKFCVAKEELQELKKFLKDIDGNHDLMNLEQTLKDKTSELKVLEKQLEDLGEVPSKKFLDYLEEDLNNIQEIIDLKVAQKNISEKMEEFERLKKEYFQEVEYEIKTIKPKILDDESVNRYEKEISVGATLEAKRGVYTKTRRELIFLAKKNGYASLVKGENDDEIINQLRDQELKDKEELSTLNKKLQDDAQKRKENIPYDCPECKTSLVMCKDGLRKHSDFDPNQIMSEAELKTFQNTIKQQENKLTIVSKLFNGFLNLEKPPSISGDLLDIKKRYEDHKVNIVKYNSLVKTLDQESLSSTLIKMKKGIPDSPLKKKFPNKVDIHTSETFLESRMTDNIEKVKEEVGEMLAKGWQTYSTSTTLTLSINKLNKEIEKLQIKVDSAQGEHGSREELVKKIDNKSEEVDSIRENIDSTRKNINDYEEFQRYKKHFLKVKKLKEAYEQHKNNSKDAEQKYNASLLLEKKHKEAEVISIEGVINTINELASGYLDVFFETEPISVTCDITKKTKNDVKFKVNTSIFYKGAEYVSYEELSQGELVKVNLAYILALNTYFGSDLLMLDEFLENLDSEVVIDVIDKLKTLSQEKCIIIVDHNAIEGVYDHVLEL